MKRVGFVCCSNGQQPERKDEIEKLVRKLSEAGIDVVKAEHLYAGNSIFGGTAGERAEDLMAFYRDENIDAVFDVSGGDIANEVLDFLDYNLIGSCSKTFWGYSDLTTVINAIYTKTGKSSVLYQVKNLVSNDAKLQQKRFQEFQSGRGTDLFDIHYHFLQGNDMSGAVVGGNIRCFLKLAGTPYWPDMNGKILLLEAFGGEIAQIAAYFAQLSQLGVFESVSGVLLGTFTRFEESGVNETVFDILSPYIGAGLPVAKTTDIGHGSDARAAMIGGYARFVEIKTERLRLKPLGTCCLNTVHEYAKDPENTKYMEYLPNDSIDETRNFLKGAEEEWKKEKPSFYEFAVLMNELQIGAVSLYIEDEAKAELGWIINKKFWNQGIAYEAAAALLTYAEEKLGIHRFIAHCDSENAASRRVMEKLGMRKTGEWGGRKNRLSDEERIEFQYEVQR